MEDGNFIFLKYTGTDEQDEKHSLQRSCVIMMKTHVIMMKTHVKKGYIC
jgi:hypothetical protein